MKSVLKRADAATQHALAAAVASDDPRETIDCIMSLSKVQLDALDADAAALVHPLVK